MNKKIQAVVEIVVVVILIFIVVRVFRGNSNTENADTTDDVTGISYNEESEEYQIIDEETGEVLHSASSEDELYIYTIDPDYDPQNPDAVTEGETIEAENTTTDIMGENLE